MELAGAIEAGMCCREPDATARPSGLSWGTCAVLFLGSAAGTVVWGASMADMPGMPMSGGWTMSMSWMRMPQQTWLGAAASFLGMWTLMMVAMMLPSLVPALWRYRQAVAGARGAGRADALGVLVGAGYFLVWAGQGALVFPLGVAVAGAAMRWPVVARAVPLGVAVVLLAAGLVQTTPWKARHLACCRGTRLVAPLGDAAGALRHGLRLGLHCGACCAGLTAALLVAGVMDLTVMAAVTAAVTAERLAPGGASVRIARTVGAVLVATGLFLIARALWPR